MNASTRQFLFRALAGASLLLLAGCSRHGGHGHEGHDHASHAKHEHHAPHGGTVVVLGDEEYHLELVRDAATGTLSAYVLDGELEKFIRIDTPTLTIVATVAGEARTLELAAVASTATGESVGDTSHFETRIGWLKTIEKFEAVIPALTIRGTAYSIVRFNFPEGNDPH